MSNRVYLDWNATTPVRSEARKAMIAAMDVVGNPSSVHAEGRAVKGIIERAREQIAAAFGCDRNGIIFTSSATEAAALGLNNARVTCADIEHDCVAAYADASLGLDDNYQVSPSGDAVIAVQGANSETGICQTVPKGSYLTDQVQVFGKQPVAFNWLDAKMAILSAHKIGGPKGIGALVLQDGIDIPAHIRGGGQEQGRRSGTENVIGIAGFGAAATAAVRDLDKGVWDQVAELRDNLEDLIQNAAPDAIIVGQDLKRLPNTSNFAVPGWKGETQVMNMDLCGFAISAGSACSSGKVKSSRVLKAMGYDDITASSAIRVSLGPTTTKAEITHFADAWAKAYKKYAARAA